MENPVIRKLFSSEVQMINKHITCNLLVIKNLNTVFLKGFLKRIGDSKWGVARQG
jgi:hypothetical protein